MLAGTAAMADSSLMSRKLKASSQALGKQTGFVEATFESIPAEHKLLVPLSLSLIYNLLD